MTSAAVLSHPRVAAHLGYLGDWLADHEFTVTRLIRDEVVSIDAADDADVLIVMGSPWTLAEGRRTLEHAAAIDAEVDLVRRWVSMDRPMLGICFGGQVLSVALGGSVTRMPQTMLAWQVLSSHDSALRGPWALWHEDRFTVPPGAAALAVAPHAPMAITARRAWGVQFHPEFTADIMRQVADDLGTPEEQAGPMIAIAQDSPPQRAATSAAFFDAWWEAVR